MRPLAHSLWLWRTSESFTPIPGPECQTQRVAVPDLSGHTSALYLPETAGPGEPVSPPHLFHPILHHRPLALTLAFHLYSAVALQQFYIHVYSSFGRGKKHMHIDTLAHILAHWNTSIPLSFQELLCILAPRIKLDFRLQNIQPSKGNELQHPWAKTAHSLALPCDNILQMSFMKKMKRTTSKASKTLWAQQKLPPYRYGIRGHVKAGWPRASHCTSEP